jgi:hypothetical protein
MSVLLFCSQRGAQPLLSIHIPYAAWRELCPRASNDHAASRRQYVMTLPSPTDRTAAPQVNDQAMACVPPVTHAAAARVEERWSELIGPAEFETLRATLLHLLDALKDQ